MFYETSKNDHGLLRDPFKSLVIPRPIAWISSQDENGNINLAPYSYFNIVSDKPAMVMFSTIDKRSDGTLKDTLHNVETQKEFVVNIATYDLRMPLNLTSSPLLPDQNEFIFADLNMLPSTLVKPPRVKCSPIQLECVYYQSIQLPVESSDEINRMVIGKVIGVHINDDVIVNGKIDLTKIKPIARLGYQEFAVIESIFTMQRP